MNSTTLRIAFLSSAAMIGIAVPSHAFAAEAEVEAAAQTVVGATDSAEAPAEAGEIVVVTDDDGRENEGDLIVAAVHCTADKMAFIVRHTSGIVCTPMPKEEAKRLNLSAMVAEVAMQVVLAWSLPQ